MEKYIFQIVFFNPTHFHLVIKPFSKYYCTKYYCVKTVTEIFTDLQIFPILVPLDPTPSCVITFPRRFMDAVKELMKLVGGSLDAEDRTNGLPWRPLKGKAEEVLRYTV